MLGEIAGIKKNLALLDSILHSDLTTILNFDGRFRDQVGQRHSMIQPPNFDTARRVPIDDLFVAPMLIKEAEKKEQGVQPIEFEEFRQGIHRTVLLGNPGGGKSTLAQKLTYDLATRSGERHLPGREVTPVLVVLREYGASKKTEGLSLLQFIEKQARSRYQVAPPPGAFEYLFLNGRAFVIFDGLDELLDTHYRQEISGDVESFCNLYPAVPALVTSREVGYDQAPLDGRVFNLYTIAPFSDEQVEAYAQKWFDRDEDLLPDQRMQKAEAFLRESALAQDLRSNPLMLALMCNLYRVEGYIPRNRPDVYEKCSVMLFERWDKGRGILVQLPFEAHVRPAMQHLAYWIYSNDAHQAGVTETLLAEQTSAYLSKWVFEDPHEASRAANDFIEFCTGRAWVFTDTGTTPDGEKLFQFTHRTFLEYFSANYLCSVHATPAELAAALLPRIGKREWDVVAQLAFQMQGRRIQGAADLLLGDLLTSASAADPVARRSFLTFALKCLQSMVPSPRVRRSVAIACIEAFTDNGNKHSPDGAYYSEGPFEIIDLLRYVNAENRPSVAAVCVELLTSAANGTDVKRCLVALEGALYLSGFQGSQDDWTAIASHLLASLKERLLLFARSDFDLAVQGYHRGLIPLADGLNWHGPDFVFRGGGFKTAPWFYAPKSLSFLNAISGRPVFHGAASPGDFSILGNYLINRRTPWIALRESTRPGYPSEEAIHILLHSMPGAQFTDKLDSAGKFATFALLAVSLEIAGDVYGGRLLSAIERSDDQQLRNLTAVFRRRLDPAAPSTFAARNGAFSDEQDSLIHAWAEGKISFVARRDSGPTDEQA